MTSRKVEVKNNIGLHASPAAFFINEACSFHSTIWVEKGDRKANAKSLMSVLSLCARQGESLLITADGIWRRIGYAFPSVLILVLFLARHLLVPGIILSEAEPDSRRNLVYPFSESAKKSVKSKKE